MHSICCELVLSAQYATTISDSKRNSIFKYSSTIIIGDSTSCHVCEGKMTVISWETFVRSVIDKVLRGFGESRWIRSIT